MINQHDDRAPAGKWLSDHLPIILLWLGVIGFGCVLAVGWFYHEYFPGPIQTEHGMWGVFGDFFGGTLNPVFAFLGFIGLLLTLAVQQRALNIAIHDATEQRASLALQNFERTFFELVRLHHEIVKGMDLPANEGVTILGRDCFRVFYTKLKEEYRKVSPQSEFNRILHDVVLNLPDSAPVKQEPLKILEAAYTLFFRDNQHEVGHYFRTLTGYSNSSTVAWCRKRSSIQVP